MRYFDDHLSPDEAKQHYRRLARQFHPDVACDDGATMQRINTEYEQFKRRRERPAIAVAAPGLHADPHAWFAAMKQAAHAAVHAAPEQRQQAARQAEAHRPISSTPPPPPPSSPAAPPPPTASHAAASSAGATATATATGAPHRTTHSPSTKQRTHAAQVAQREEDDYRNARSEPKDKYGCRRSGNAVIFWEDASWDSIECIAVLTPSRPRHEIRKNGHVVHSEPATRKWKAERQVIIERAQRLIS